jgi:hypothetical protein
MFSKFKKKGSQGGKDGERVESRKREWKVGNDSDTCNNM